MMTAVCIAVRLIGAIQSLEALDVFAMIKEQSLNALAEILTDGKVNTCYQFHI